MRRREFIALIGGAAAAWPLSARAQSHASTPRIVMYSATEPLASMHENSENRYIRTLYAEMRRLGHVEGKNLKIERYGRETSASDRKRRSRRLSTASPISSLSSG